MALFDDDHLVAGECVILGRGHAERLVPLIASLPAKGRADRVAVSIGPGSFTGLRVGIAAARALAMAWRAEIVGFPTLELVAAMARMESGTVDVLVAMTGGHGEWFVQDFDEGGIARTDVQSIAPDAAAASFATEHVAGSQAEALVSRRASGKAHSLLPDARYINLLSQRVFSSSVQPIYGRGPDAQLPGSVR